MPQLSIVTINFNDRDGLEKTIRSVISQTYTDFEFIIIDGGSADGSVDVIKKYSDKISCWISEKDSGIYNAQNKGIKAAKGNYCLFLNSGDQLADENILKKVFLNGLSEDIVYGDMKVDWGNRKVTLEKMHPKISLFEMFIDTIWHPSAFIKRDLFEKYGLYDESYKIVADYEFFFRVTIAHHVSTHHISKAISVFQFNGVSSKPENKSKEQEERKRVWKTYLSDSQIASLEKKVEEENLKKKKLFNRIIKKMKF